MSVTYLLTCPVFIKNHHIKTNDMPLETAGWKEHMAYLHVSLLDYAVNYPKDQNH